jgi:hypothetical protein
MRINFPDKELTAVFYFPGRREVFYWQAFYSIGDLYPPSQP